MAKTARVDTCALSSGQGSSLALGKGHKAQKVTNVVRRSISVHQTFKIHVLLAVTMVKLRQIALIYPLAQSMSSQLPHCSHF